MFSKQADHRHHEARRAEPALETVAFVESLLDGVQRCSLGSETFDCHQVVALGLNGEHQARADRRAVEQDGAAAAHTVLAPYVRAGQAEVVAKVVRQQAARVGRRRMIDAVYPHAANNRSVRMRTR
jgi:hypothetical protein